MRCVHGVLSVVLVARCAAFWHLTLSVWVTLLLHQCLARVQFERSTYANERDEELRMRLNHLQYVSYLKSTSDADRGRSGQHGVSKRSNGRWQSRITGIAVKLHLC
jgi:hypothetical protein